MRQDDDKVTEETAQEYQMRIGRQIVRENVANVAKEQHQQATSDKKPSGEAKPRVYNIVPPA